MHSYNQTFLCHTEVWWRFSNSTANSSLTFCFSASRPQYTPCCLPFIMVKHWGRYSLYRKLTFVVVLRWKTAANDKISWLHVHIFSQCGISRWYHAHRRSNSVRLQRQVRFSCCQLKIRKVSDKSICSTASASTVILKVNLELTSYLPDHVRCKFLSHRYLQHSKPVAISALRNEDLRPGINVTRTAVGILVPAAYIYMPHSSQRHSFFVQATGRHTSTCSTNKY